MSSADTVETYRVLVIDDNPDMHLDFVQIFSTQRKVSDTEAIEKKLFKGWIRQKITADKEYLIDSAMCGEEGVEKIIEASAAGNPYALAFVDIRMPPGWDGIKTTEKAWQVDPAIQIVICTAYSDYSWGDIRFRLGSTSNLLLLKKPFDSIEVQQLASSLTEKWKLTAYLHSRAKELEDANENLRKAVDEIRTQEKKYRLLADNITDTIWLIDIRTMTFKYISPSMMKITGYSSEEAKSHLSDLIMPRESFQRIMDITYRELEPDKDSTLSRDRSTTIEVELNHKNGQRVWAEVTASFLRDDDGQPVDILGVARDITERKKAEEALKELNRTLEQRVKNRTARLEATNKELERAKEDAEAAGRAKGDFLANMSHEIRTPLNGVIGAADLALTETSPEKINHYLKVIRSSGTALMGIINTILDFSKIEAGKLDLEIRPFLLDKVLDEVVLPFIQTASENKIELIVDLDPDVPVSLTGDSLRIKQILTNLLSNAFKFTDKGGVITIGIGESSGKIDRHHIQLEICVNDTGIGITNTQLKRLFKPFTQSDTSTTREYGGTGLGLSICKQLVEMMEGNMWVKSSPGQGSTFGFTLVLERQKSALKGKMTVPEELDGLKILAIDDNSKIRNLYKKIFRSFNFPSDTTSSGIDGLRLLKGADTSPTPFDLVFVDREMEGMDGLETAKQIREELQLSVPVVIASAHSRGIDIEAGLKKNIDGFLKKPFHASSLLNTVMDIFVKSGSDEAGDIENPAAEIMTAINGFQPMHLLVAEDNSTSSEITRDLLLNAGYRVSIAENGKKAVNAFLNNDFNAILMDVQMPEMDGIEATMHIREIEKNLKNEDSNSLKGSKAPIPIIAMTAHALKGDEEKCIKAGMDGYIAKPINREVLLKEIAKRIPIDHFLSGDDPEKNMNTAALKRLTEALKASNPDEIQEAFAPIKPLLDRLQMDRLKQYIENYDYDEALEEIEKISGKFPESMR